jgi:hypothetical protein
MWCVTWTYLNQSTSVTAINYILCQNTHSQVGRSAWSAWGGQSSRAEARRATLRGVSSWWPWPRTYPMGGRLSKNVDIAWTVLGGTNAFIWNLLDTFQIPTKSNRWFVLSISHCDTSWSLWGFSVLVHWVACAKDCEELQPRVSRV